MRWRHVGIVVALIAGACSSGDGGSESGIAVLYTPPGPNVIVPRSGTQAFGDIDLTLVTEVPNNTFTENVNGRIDLGCDEC